MVVLFSPYFNFYEPYTLKHKLATKPRNNTHNPVLPLWTLPNFNIRLLLSMAAKTYLLQRLSEGWRHRQLSDEKFFNQTNQSKSVINHHRRTNRLKPPLDTTVYNPSVSNTDWLQNRNAYHAPAIYLPPLNSPTYITFFFYFSIFSSTSYS